MLGMNHCVCLCSTVYHKTQKMNNIEIALTKTAYGDIQIELEFQMKYLFLSTVLIHFGTKQPESESESDTVFVLFFFVFKQFTRRVRLFLLVSSRKSDVMIKSSTRNAQSEIL